MGRGQRRCGSSEQAIFPGSYCTAPTVLLSLTQLAPPIYPIFSPQGGGANAELQAKLRALSATLSGGAGVGEAAGSAIPGGATAAAGHREGSVGLKLPFAASAAYRR